MEIEKLSKLELKDITQDFIREIHVVPMVHAIEGGVIYLDEILMDFVKYLKTK